MAAEYWPICLSLMCIAGTSGGLIVARLFVGEQARPSERDRSEGSVGGTGALRGELSRAVSHAIGGDA